MSEELENTSLESQIENSLVKQNVTDAVINGLKEKYKDLKLRSLDDKEKYLEIKEAAKEVGKVRILATKICKAGREEANKIQKLWVAKEKEVVGKIAEVENPLDAEITAFDNEVNRKKEEGKRQQEQAYIERTQALTRMGALYSDNSFSLGETSIEGNLVKESSEDVWAEEILPKFKEEYEKAQAERLEIERQKAAHEAELKRQQEELLQKQREFEQQQAAFKAEQQRAANEAAEKQRIIINKRSATLSELGLKYNGSEYYFQDVNVANIEVSTLSDEEFSALVEKIKPVIEERKAVESKKIQDEIEKQKQAAIEEAARKERERIDRERILAEEQRRQDEIKKAEELAKSGDKAIWNHFITELNKVVLPTAKSGGYRTMCNLVKEKIEEIINLKPR